MASPKFSILVPAFKANFLNECIDSILAQTYTDFELVILNDHSPDDLDSIVETYSDPRIHYHHNDHNVGIIDQIDNWNKCLSLSSGAYVLCMGDDDRLLPNCLEEYAKLIDKYPDVLVFHGWTEIIDEKSAPYAIQEMSPEYESFYSLLWRRLNGRMSFIVDFLFRSDALKARGGFFKLPMGWGSDDLSVFFAAEKYGIVNTQVPVSQYRKSRFTISNSVNASIKIEALLLYEKEVAKLLEHYALDDKTSPAFLFYNMCRGAYRNWFRAQRIEEMIISIKSKGLVSGTRRAMSVRKKFGLGYSEVAKAFLKVASSKAMN